MVFLSKLLGLLAVRHFVLSGAVDDFPPERFPFADRFSKVTDIPQFITITIDDGVSPSRLDPIRTYLMTPRDKRGCWVPFTAFVSFDWSLCELVKGLERAGIELGTHTMAHTGYPTLEQISDAINYMNSTCDIPKEKIRGFRTPYLAYDQSTFDSLAALSVLYDTTVIDDDDVNSKFGAENVWPYTMNYAAQSGIYCECDTSKGHAGLWEIPMYRFYDAKNSPLSDVMDYPSVSLYMDQNFLRHYNGNRAPFGIYIHAPWLQLDGNNNGVFMKSWIQGILDKYTDVFFVTNQQLLAWMKDPVPLSSYTPPSCAGYRPDCFPPGASYACAWNEVWNSKTCTCVLQGPTPAPVKAPVKPPVSVPVPTAPVPVPTAPVPVPTAPVPVPTAPVPVPTAPVPVPAPTPVSKPVPTPVAKPTKPKPSTPVKVPSGPTPTAPVKVPTTPVKVPTTPVKVPTTPVTTPVKTPVKPPTSAPTLAPTSAPCCPNGFSGLKSWGDCTRYYTCDRGTLAYGLQICSATLLFDDTYQTCNYADRVKCPNNTCALK